MLLARYLHVLKLFVEDAKKKKRRQEETTVRAFPPNTAHHRTTPPPHVHGPIDVAFAFRFGDHASFHNGVFQMVLPWPWQLFRVVNDGFQIGFPHKIRDARRHPTDFVGVTGVVLAGRRDLPGVVLHPFNGRFPF